MSSGRRWLTCYYRRKPGGLCRRLFRGMEALAERGHEVHYLAVERFPLRHERCHFHALWVPTARRQGLLFWAWFTLAAPPVLLWLGWRHRVEGLFVFGAFYGALMQPLRRLRRLPLTVLLRADALTNHRLAGRPRWIRLLQRAVEGLGLAGARVLAVTATLAETVRRRHPRLPPHRVGVLPNDVPLPVAHRNDSGRPPGAPVRAAAVGILERRKNPFLLLPVMQVQDPRSVVLTFYGSGPELERLRRQVDRGGLGDRVRLAGWRPAEELWAEVDLLLMPSLHEGAPNAVLEALAHGVPVLASDLPEHREILPEASLLPADDPAPWARSLGQLAADPVRTLPALAGQQRRATAHLRFDWDDAFVDAVLEDPPAC